MDYTDAYNKGLSLFENRDFYNAKSYFMISKDSIEYRKKSLNALALIEIYTSNYQKARNILNTYKDELYFEYTTTYSFIEKIEFNLNKGFDIILDSFKNIDNQNKKLSFLADFYIELGDYNKARLVLETLSLTYNYVSATIKLIYLDIIERDFVNALKLFKTIEDSLDSDTYNQIKSLITYHIGTIHDTKKLNKHTYCVKRLLLDDESILVKHIKVRHINKHDETASFFLKNTDIINLIDIVKLMIKDLNPNFDRNALIYNIKFPHLIGYNMQIPTNSIKVVVALGTNKIITMYPCILSNEFNLEGLKESKELMLKRDLKWKN